MEQKIAELTEKIYKEGVEKGEEQKRAIIEAARAEAVKIRNDAQNDADGIISQAKAHAEELKRNVDSEIKLSSQQAIQALKQKIVDSIMAEVIDKNVSEAFANPDLIKELLITMVQNWKSHDQDIESMQVLLPEQNQKKFEKSIEQSLNKILKNGVTVSYSKALKGGFHIGPQDGSFKISFSEEDFNEFIKEFLRPKARNYLFNE